MDKAICIIFVGLFIVAWFYIASLLTTPERMVGYEPGEVCGSTTDFIQVEGASMLPPPLLKVNQ